MPPVTDNGLDKSGVDIKATLLTTICGLGKNDKDNGPAYFLLPNEAPLQQKGIHLFCFDSKKKGTVYWASLDSLKMPLTQLIPDCRAIVLCSQSDSDYAGPVSVNQNTDFPFTDFVATDLKVRTLENKFENGLTDLSPMKSNAAVGGMIQQGTGHSFSTAHEVSVNIMDRITLLGYILVVSVGVTTVVVTVYAFVGFICFLREERTSFRSHVNRGGLIYKADDDPSSELFEPRQHIHHAQLYDAFRIHSREVSLAGMARFDDSETAAEIKLLGLPETLQKLRAVQVGDYAVKRSTIVSAPNEVLDGNVLSDATVNQVGGVDHDDGVVSDNL